MAIQKLNFWSKSNQRFVSRRIFDMPSSSSFDFATKLELLD